MSRYVSDKITANQQESPPLTDDSQHTLLLLPTTTSYITAWLSHHLKLSSMDARTNHPIPPLRTISLCSCFFLSIVYNLIYAFLNDF